MVFSAELPKRKPNRLQSHVYSMNGVYFLTICIKEKAPLFGDITDGQMRLTELGMIAEECLRDIESNSPTVWLEAFSVMPNHVHLLLILMGATKNPSVSTVIQQFKSVVTKRAGFPFWQKSFDDRILYSANRVRTVITYINDNPKRWKENRYHPDCTNASDIKIPGDYQSPKIQYCFRYQSVSMQKSKKTRPNANGGPHAAVPCQRRPGHHPLLPPPARQG